MSKSVEFNKTLLRLFEHRSDWLLHVIGKRRPGAPPAFGRKKLQRAIQNLQTIASASLASKLAKTEFANAVVGKKKAWHVRGRGAEGKRSVFNKWFEEHIPYRSVIYVFWKGRRCLYVGKTRHGRGRPSAHFDRNWFSRVTRIDVYAVKGKRSLPSMECLAIHRFQPSKNKNKAQSAKWTKKCPLCRVHRSIKSGVESIFKRK